jgi:hypothetical protein
MKIVHNKDLEQITFLDERFYLHSPTGGYYPSATTVLDVYPKGYGFLQWLKNLGNNADEVVRQAQEQGTKIHDAIESFLNGKELVWVTEEKENFTLDEWLMLVRFYDFYTTFKPEPIAVEQSLVSPELGFGGTLDLVCKLPDFPKEVFYIDWKSGNAIYKNNKIQGAAYCKLWNSLIKEKITRVGCLHLRALTRGPAKGKIQGEGWRLEEVEDIEHEYKLFEHSLAIWREENPEPKPKNVIYPDRLKNESTHS